MHLLFLDPDLSRMLLHPQIQIPNAFPDNKPKKIKPRIKLGLMHGHALPIVSHSLDPFWVSITLICKCFVWFLKYFYFLYYLIKYLDLMLVYVWNLLLLSSVKLINLFPTKCNVLFFILFESSLWSQVNTQGPDNGLIWVQLFNFKKQLSCLG